MVARHKLEAMVLKILLKSVPIVLAAA